MAEVVTIASLGHSGDGIADTSEGRVFVPLTLPGEEVEIERKRSRAHLLQVLRASPDRIAPVCRHFGECGTCALEHMGCSAYLAWKRNLVVSAFRQRGIDAPVEPIVPIGLGARRRAVFSAVKTARGVILGFHRRAGTEIVAIDECPVLAPRIVVRLGTLRELADIALGPGTPARVIVVLADNGLDIAVESKGKLDRGALEALGRFGSDEAIARLTVNDTEVFQKRRPEIHVGPAALLPVPGGFLQATAAAERALAEAMVSHIGDVAPAADLFAGIGTFTLRLATKAPVTAVEGDAALLSAIDAAARKASGLKAITSRRRDLFRNPLVAPELDGFGAVVFDPPAAGAKAQAEMLAASSVPRIAAVSCNPATLARDARILVDGGYRLDRVLPVDQFLFSAEVEAVALFTRG